MAYEPYIARTLDEPLPYPHHSRMGLWAHARIIYGARVKTDGSAYSDRMVEWDVSAATRATEACAAAGLAQRTARWCEAWIAAYYGRPVILRYILAGVNWGNGYPYYFYGWDWAESEGA